MDGTPSTLAVTVDPATGAVSLVCTPPQAEVDVVFSATGGSVDAYWVFDATLMDYLFGDSGVSANTTSVLVGHGIRAGFQDAMYFTYDCGSGPMEPTWDMNQSAWAGICDHGAIATDKTIGVTFMTP